MRRFVRPAILVAALLGFAGSQAGAQDFERGIAKLRAGDYATALALLRPLAEAGHAGAQYQIGVAHEYGRGLERDDSAALSWYRS